MFERKHSSTCHAAWLILSLTLARNGVAQPSGSSAKAAAQTTEPETSAVEAKPKGPKNSADWLFRSGREAMQHGDYAAACAQFAESDRIEPSPGAKLNRALCEEPLGHLALAWRLLQTCIDELPADDERSLIAQRHAAELRSKLAFVTITFRAGKSPKASRVTLDGAELPSAEFGVPKPLDVGAHVIEVTADGHSAKVTEFRLSAGDQQRFELSLGTPLVEPSRKGQHEAVPLQTSPWRTVGFGLGGAGVAMAATCIVTGVLAHEAKQDMTRGCDAQSACSAEGMQAAARGETYAAVSTASFVGALVSGGLAAVLLLSNPRAPERLTIGARSLRWEF